MEWIDINLPWRTDSSPEMDTIRLEGDANYRLLSDRADAFFGFTSDASRGVLEKALGGTDTYAITKDRDIFDIRPRDNEWLAKMASVYAADSKELAIARHWNYVNNHNDWWDVQPEAIAWQARFKELNDAHKLHSFSLRPECRPGVIIKVKPAWTEDMKKYLIGDIDMNGGGCGCCSGINDDDIVLQYFVAIDLASPVNY